MNEPFSALVWNVFIGARRQAKHSGVLPPPRDREPRSRRCRLGSPLFRHMIVAPAELWSHLPLPARVCNCNKAVQLKEGKTCLRGAAFCQAARERPGRRAPPHRRRRRGTPLCAMR